MKLEMLYYNDKVTVFNPEGHIGILTLWSRTDVVIKKIIEEVGMMPPGVAVISNLYGDGLNQLLVNLLNNPQITHLFIVGNNRTDSARELMQYFASGVEEVRISGSVQYRISGTTRLVNEVLADSTLFVGRVPDITAYCFGPLDEQIGSLCDGLQRAHPASVVRERKPLKLAEPQVSVFPSVRQGHQVISDSPLDAWGELLFLLQRFGLPTTLAKGDRKELLNLKVVITKPDWQSEDDYSRYNLDKRKLEQYCHAMMDPTLDADISYTYGNRIQEYFGYDMVERAVRRLVADKEDRKSYLSLWDARADMEDRNPDGSPHGHPCWVGGFFRVYDGALTLSVTFRTHRAYTAYIENIHGLMSLQHSVANRLGLPVGPLTVLSHSISLDPGQLSLVDSIVRARKWKLRDDGRGEVVFSISDRDGVKRAVVEHRQGGMVLKRYESANIEALGHQLAQDYIASDTNHLLYIGRMLGKLQMCLKHGLDFEES